jgi:hypothetical protein
VTVRILALACACALCGLPALSACSSQRPAPVPGTSEPAAGRTVTQEVPHSTESITDIREREAKEPLPPRGDKAIHSHKIRGADNSTTNPGQGNAPAGTQNRPGTAPDPSGGY